jgi:hypothetical protein
MQGAETRVNLTHRGLHTFPLNNGDFAKESFHGGWSELIGTLLKELWKRGEMAPIKGLHQKATRA